MIKIGVTACFLYPDSSRTYFSPKILNYFENDMANYLYRKDVLPILIPHLKQENLLHFLEKMDGFVFQGGSDLCPKTYGEDYLNEEKWPGDKGRDDYELTIADYAFQHQKPILGICRGAQLLNVYFGGTLYQDLETQYPHAAKHKDAQLYDHRYHPIEFKPQTLLHTLYKNESHPHVNSIHHQGIKTLGKHLMIEAISPQDQLIEAFSYKNMHEHFVLAVQWHPEFSHTLQDKIISADPIYDFFLNAIR